MTSTLVDIDDTTTLPELLRRRVKLTPDGEAYRQFDARTARWISYRWAEIGRRVEHWQRALAQESLPAGARVAILVPNCVEHVCMDQAVLALGMVPVPLHATDNPENIAFILGDCGASLLLLDSRERWRELLPLRSQFPELRRTLCLEAAAAGGEPTEGCTRVESWLAAVPDEPHKPAAERAMAPTDMAAIVYTSGTTGRPKGVMLSHRNVASNVRALLELVAVHPGDRMLSFLPLSHTFERTVGYYLPIAAGCSVAYVRSIQTLAEDLRTVQPSILVSVPRIYERIYARVQDQVARRGRIATLLLAAAERVGWRRFVRAEGGRAPRALFDALLWPLLERAIARPLLAQFGGRVRLALTGGAPMPESIAHTFLALGLPVVQGYGMTESGPVVSAQIPGDNEPASVGRPLRGVEVKIGADDELLVKGANVMLGYWNRPEDSARAVDSEGWLHTGDQARIESGRLYIKGRIKDIIVTSTGEKIPPADLELAIAKDPLFAQAMVVGERRPFLIALLVLDRTTWEREARSLGLDPDDPEAPHTRAAEDFALARVRAAARGFPVYATPRKVWLTLEPWTIASGEITPTLKLKRLALQEHFSTQIESLYRGR